ncbi:MAG: hypothetical protein GYB68_09525 [Chloroflexi bacterium]|nr:hypothetical protein [Chloroflexota bacterium]
MTDLIFHSQVLIDAAALAGVLPDATGAALARAIGGDPTAWTVAYRRVRADWDSYWADLNLSGDDAIEVWREGRWRVVRALFRLMDRPYPPLSKMQHHLTDVTYEIGKGCAAAVRPAVLARLQRLRHQHDLHLVSPFLAWDFVWGVAAGAGAEDWIHGILGPAELGQIGLEGLSWRFITGQLHVDPTTTGWVGPAQPDWPLALDFEQLGWQLD